MAGPFLAHPPASAAKPPWSPLYNVGDHCAPQKSNLDDEPFPEAVRADWLVHCDKLRLIYPVAGSATELPGPLGSPFSDWRRARNIGAMGVETRFAFQSPKKLDGIGTPILWEHRRHENMLGTYLMVEFNPRTATDMAYRYIGATLTTAGVVGEPVVDRVDVAFDVRMSKRWLMFDPGRSKVSTHGRMAWGHQTEQFGYTKGSKFKGRLYSRDAKRRSDGEENPEVVTRLEYEVWNKAQRLTQPLLGAVSGPGGLSAEPEAGPFPLSRLGDLACPMPEDHHVLQLVCEPKGYADQRYLALGAVSLLYGPKAVRDVARELLGVRAAAEASCVMWHDRASEIRRAFARQWCGVVEGLRVALETSLEANGRLAAAVAS